MLLLVGACCALAWIAGSPLAAPAGGDGAGSPGATRAFVALLAAAFAAYLIGLRFVDTRRVPVRAVAGVAAAIQSLPLAAPLLLSTDAWTYWAYGRLAAVRGANPYEATPGDFPADPALEWAGSAWHGVTSVYGPAFTLASEPLALAAGSSAAAAAWTYKALAAAAAVAIVLLAARLAPRPAFAAAFVGWNPVLAIHVAGGGHNDAWVGALAVAALALAAAGRNAAAAASWVLSIAVKWVSAPLLLLHVVARGGRWARRDYVALAAAGAVVAAAATWRYGPAWLGAFGPLTRNVLGTTSYSLPHRLSQVGVPAEVAIAAFAIVFVVGFAWLARQAINGRARLALAAGLIVACSPYVAPWYLAWVVPLAALEEDRVARVLALALSAYLLPQTIV